MLSRTAKTVKTAKTVMKAAPLNSTPLLSEAPKRGRKTGAARKLSKSVENLFDIFGRFLTFFALREKCRKMSKSVENPKIATFRRSYTGGKAWLTPSQANRFSGPFFGPSMTLRVHPAHLT